jgi:hypothetical protein
MTACRRATSLCNKCTQATSHNSTLLNTAGPNARAAAVVHPHYTTANKHTASNILLKGQARSTAQAQKKHQVCTSGNARCVQHKLVKGKRYTSSNQTHPSKSMQRSTPHATPTLSLHTPQHILSCDGLRCGDTTVGRWTNAQADGQQSAIHQQSSRDAHASLQQYSQAKLEHITPNSCCCVPRGRYSR